MSSCTWGTLTRPNRPRRSAFEAAALAARLNSSHGCYGYPARLGPPAADVDWASLRACPSFARAPSSADEPFVEGRRPDRAAPGSGAARTGLHTPPRPDSAPRERLARTVLLPRPSRRPRAADRGIGFPSPGQADGI